MLIISVWTRPWEGNLLKQQLTAVFYGWLTMIILLIFVSTILALFLRFSPLKNPLLDQLAMIASFLILFISGFISGAKAKQKAWIIGSGLSLSYSFLIYLFQFLGYGEHFTLTQVFYHLGFLLVAIIGAIFGVNVTGNQKAS